MARHGRKLAWAAVLGAVALCYLLSIQVFHIGSRPVEKAFPPSSGRAAPLAVYIEPVSIDPANVGMRIRLSFWSGTSRAAYRAAVPEQDMTVRVSDYDSVHEFAFRAGEPMKAVTVDIDLDDGDFSLFPLDQYRATLWVRAETASEMVPLVLTMWTGGLAGFNVTAAHLADAPAPGTWLKLTIPRAGAVVLLAFAIYGAMVAVACAALAIVVIVLAGWRPPESSLLGTLISMVFTQILLRNAVPGAPPLGVRGDIAVFLWAEIVCVLCLLAFIVIWARHRPRDA
jgi:hypothetical protein